MSDAIQRDNQVEEHLTRPAVEAEERKTWISVPVDKRDSQSCSLT